MLLMRGIIIASRSILAQSDRLQIDWNRNSKVSYLTNRLTPTRVESLSLNSNLGHAFSGHEPS